MYSIRTALTLAFAALLGGAGSAWACGEVFRGELVLSEREIGALAAGESKTVHVIGAGWLRAVEISKRGGIDDNTSITLELDGQPLLTTTFAALKNPWMQLDTAMMGAKVRTEGDTSVMTLWYSPELRFTTMAVLRIDVQEDGVFDMKTRTVMNKPAPHEHIAGQQIGTTAAVALPAFK